MSHQVKASESVLLVVDVQERFRPVIRDWDGMVASIIKLILGLRTLEVPILATEQYPKGLGKTVGEIATELGAVPVEKTWFSCLAEPEFRARLEALGRSHLILCGIEAHVCVLNTALDALDLGYRVSYVVEAISSRRAVDKEVAMTRLAQAGAYPATVESILFQLLKRAGGETFKRIQAIVK